MKAIIKKTGEAILVTKAGVTVNDTGERMIKWYCEDNDTLYDTEELMLCNIIDWEQRKYEIVRTVIPISIEHHYNTVKKANESGYSYDYIKESIEWACNYANTLIKKLQDEYTDERRGNTGI